MPPRETVNCDADVSESINGRTEAHGFKRVNGTGPRMHAHRVAGKGNAAVVASAGEIPWRTSRRLQEATLRLIKERDGGQPHSHVSVKEEDNSRSTNSWPATCSPKRRQWESDLREQKQEDYSDDVSVECSENPSGAEAERTACAAETAGASLGCRRKVKRRRKAQLNDPRRLFTQDEKKKGQLNDPLLLFTQTENKSVTSTSSDANDDDDVFNHISTPAAACKGAARKKVEPTIVGSGPKNSVKLPQSCFDLHCSHVGFRGWRCYRSRTAGQVFCVYHQRESTQAAGICLYI